MLHTNIFKVPSFTQICLSVSCVMSLPRICSNVSFLWPLYFYIWENRGWRCPVSWEWQQMTFVTLNIKFCKKFDNYVTNPTTKKLLWKSNLLKWIYKKVKGDIQIHTAMQNVTVTFLFRPTHPLLKMSCNYIYSKNGYLEYKCFNGNSKKKSYFSKIEQKLVSFPTLFDIDGR